MKTETINQKKNPFLGREEFIIEISEEAMPTKEGIIEALGKGKELTVIEKIESNFGRGTFDADVAIYDSLESKEKYMTIPKKIKAKMEADKKAAEEAEKKAKAEAAAETAKKEEVSAEETPAEEPAAEEKIEEKPVEETNAPQEDVPSEEDKGAQQ